MSLYRIPQQSAHKNTSKGHTCLSPVLCAWSFRNTSLWKKKKKDSCCVFLEAIISKSRKTVRGTPSTTTSEVRL
jgi:hypothetical protein